MILNDSAAFNMRGWFRFAFWSACVVVTVLSLSPTEYLPPAAFDWWDKAQHALAFLVLGVLGLSAYPNSRNCILISLLFYAAAIEMVQSATGWRYGDWGDWVADVIGLGMGYLAWTLARPWRLFLRG